MSVDCSNSGMRVSRHSSRWKKNGELAPSASWMPAIACAAFHRLYERLDRADALREMTVRYREHMHSNAPVHTWPLP